MRLFLTKGEIELVQEQSDSETFCTTDDGVVDGRCKEDENVVGHGDVVDNLVHFSSFLGFYYSPSSRRVKKNSPWLASYPFYFSVEVECFLEFVVGVLDLTVEVTRGVADVFEFVRGEVCK